jgi:hypothetical protein
LCSTYQGSLCHGVSIVNMFFKSCEGKCTVLYCTALYWFHFNPTWAMWMGNIKQQKLLSVYKMKGAGCIYQIYRTVTCIWCAQWLIYLHFVWSVMKWVSAKYVCSGEYMQFGTRSFWSFASTCKLNLGINICNHKFCDSCSKFPVVHTFLTPVVEPEGSVLLIPSSGHIPESDSSTSHPHNQSLGLWSS